MALVALGILCGSCGGDDDPDDQPVSAGTSAPTKTGEAPRSAPAAPDTGGAAAPRGTTSSDGTQSGAYGNVRRGGESVSPAAGDKPRRTGRRKTPKRLTREVYKAGRQTCFIFGIEQIRSEYELAQRSPEAVARFYANLFEKGNPELVAPYYQGCLRGLRQRAARDEQANDR
jgi:hypothetical protein